LSGKVLRGTLLQVLLEHSDFLNTDISQGMVATYLRYGGIFKYEFVADLPLTLSVIDFENRLTFDQEFSVLFFDS